MHPARRASLWITLLVCGVLLWIVNVRRGVKTHPQGAINDLSVTSPLNQPGGGAAPGESYDLYSALYHEPLREPLVFAADSMTDIPQVNGKCLKPSSPLEREMADTGYQILTPSEVSDALGCLETHAQGTARCEKYIQLRHVRFLGIPGFDHTHTRALVSVVKKCGRVCGSGGIFEVEKTGNTWRRSETTDFTRECSWMY